MSAPITPCILIPCYNHGVFLPKLLVRLKEYQFPIIIVNDGSREETTEILHALAINDPNLVIHHHGVNQGKGGAMITGFNLALSLGYSHALQIDADGQHDITDIPTFIAQAQAHPHELISGQPIYDEHIPKARLYSRYITHFWVWVETLSLSIKDSMCGYRVYPLLETQRLIEKTGVGRYMDFDTEIMVKLYWQGCGVHFIPTKVLYPEDGLSNFRMVRDNVLISWMHMRLVLGMLIRFPKLVLRRR